MPKNCFFCRFKNIGICESKEDCPLIDVPPHGRLIDADALQRRFDRLPQTSGDVIEAEDVFDVIRTAPTIIEVEGET